MKTWQAFLMNVAVVGAGLFVYDRVRAPASGANAGDPLSADAMGRFIAQYDEMSRRQGANMGRRSRLATYLSRLSLSSLDAGAQGRLTDVLDGFQEERLGFFERVPADAADYDARYRAFVNTYIAKVNALVPDAKEAATVVERFIFDGRIIRKQQPSEAPTKDSK